jgi:hypothetical protein
MIRSITFILLSCVILTFCLACKSEEKGTETDAPASQQEATAPAPQSSPSPQEITLPYPALGNPYITALYAETEQVDIIFYDLPISVNQDDAASAKSTALYVSPTNPKITADCKPVARLSWIADGKILREADVYMDDGCEYLMFMENNEGVAVNAMSQSGVEFFKNIIRQVEKKTK